MKHIFSFLVILLISFNATAQIEIRDFFREKINSIENEFKNILTNNSYVLYGTSNKMFLFIKKDQDYLVFEYCDNNGIYELLDFKIEKHVMAEKLFKKENYEKGYLDFNSDFYLKNNSATATGLPTYFKYKVLDEVYCEYILSVITNPVPMNKDVYRYISFKILKMNFDQW